VDGGQRFRNEREEYEREPSRAALDHPQSDQHCRDDHSGDSEIQDGIAAWERLKQDTGFDLQGVFRRRALVPFVLVPRKVAAKHGSAETLSMLNNLRQAHDAFVFA